MDDKIIYILYSCIGYEYMCSFALNKENLSRNDLCWFYFLKKGWNENIYSNNNMKFYIR